MSARKILLAEDDVDDREFFNDFIKSREDVMLLDVAENGEEVFDRLLQVSESGYLPDLIILDQNMPKRNGIQTLKMLKQSEVYENIPVFIYSTYADDALRQLSIDAGATSVFSKPYTTEGYGKMLNGMLDLVK